MGNALLSCSDFSLLFISDTGLCHSFQMIGMQQHMGFMGIGLSKIFRI